MHPCLEVQEILWIIFDSILNDAPGRESTKALISLAITCHAFKEMALDILWHTQETLVPLIKCMPKDLWKEEPSTGFSRSLKFARKLSFKDFVRFHFYARRIKRLDYMPYGWHAEVDNPCDLNLLHEMQEFLAQECRNHTNVVQQALFPNLRRLQFTNPRHASYAQKVFFRSGLIGLSLTFVGTFNEGEVKSLFQPIKIHSPNIEDLYLSNEQGSTSESCPHLSGLIRSLKSLRGLATGRWLLESSAILHLATLPYVRTLRFPNCSTDILQSLTPLHSHPFASLQHLEMSGSTLGLWPTLLARLRPHQLETVTLHFDTLPLALEIQVFFVALSDTSAHSNLRSIRFTHAWKPSLPRVSPDVIIDFDVVEPLLAFGKLTTLHLGLACSFSFNDTHIAAMATSWPKLQELQLGSLLGWGKPSGVTYQSLLALVAGCPDLEKLGMSVDVSELSAETLVIHEGITNSKITYLHVGDSVIDNALGVANFLSCIFPRMNGIGGAWLYVSTGSFTQRLRLHHKLWQDVVTLIGGLRYRKT